MLGIFIASMVLSLLSVVNTLSIVNNNVLMVMLLEFIAPLLNLVILSYVIQNSDSKAKQIQGTIIAGLGYASGAGVSMVINSFIQS